jgi:hypothetical protein
MTLCGPGKSTFILFALCMSLSHLSFGGEPNTAPFLPECGRMGNRQLMNQPAEMISLKRIFERNSP